MTRNGKAPTMDSKIMRARSKAVALAALYVCESLLLELEARQVVHGEGVEGLLKDAARTLREAGEGASRADCLAASEIIDAICEQHVRIGQ